MTTKLFPATSECEIVSTRILDVSKDLLFSAWSNPAHLEKWWGPKGFSNTFLEFDFREGGKWDFMMHGPEKGNYHNEVEFVKIDEPNVIAWKRHSQPIFNVVFTFDALTENKTRLTFRMVFETEDECNKIKRFAVDKNEENFDRLEALFESMK